MNILRDKSFEFAVRIVNLCRFLNEEMHEFVLSKQLIRSGTAIGALYREAQHAESKKDFCHKLSIAQKECNETLYWLELLSKTGYLELNQFQSIYKDCDELMALLISIIRTTKKNMK